ncbi:hypothetical protein AGMMS50256_24860 [Betaproteobacteria bacterium]|nr:hypothetical protein AGMMS50256_24860 [Betaproteobacteria bacterium]
MRKNIFALVLVMILAWSFTATGAGNDDFFYSKSLEKTFTATYDSAKEKISFKYPKELEVEGNRLGSINPLFRFSFSTVASYSKPERRGTLDDARDYLKNSGYIVTDTTIDGTSDRQGNHNDRECRRRNLYCLLG